MFKIFVLLIFTGTDAFDKLHRIVSAKRLLDDIQQIFPALQTYGVKSFHSVINRFAPKAFPFSYRGIVARWVDYLDAFGNSAVTVCLTPPLVNGTTHMGEDPALPCSTFFVHFVLWLKSISVSVK